jgi:hypothetical protein
MGELDDSSPPPSPARSKPKEHSAAATPGPRLAMWSTQDPDRREDGVWKLAARRSA